MDHIFATQLSPAVVVNTVSWELSDEAKDEKAIGAEKQSRVLDLDQKVA